MLSRVFQSGSFDLPGVEFAQPLWLVLIPILSLVAWWIARGALGGWHGGRQTVHLVIRCIVIALLAIALAEPSVRWTAKDVAVMVVRDVSDSVPIEQRRLTDEFLQASVQKMPRGDRIGLLTAARGAYVQSLPTVEPRLEAGFVGDTGATDLEQAIRLAGALVPSDTGGRVLVISDGNETRGSLAAAVSSARAANLPIDVASVEYDRTGMVRVEDVVVPVWARENDTINARILVESGRAVSGRLSLTMNGTLVDLDPDSDGLSSRVDLRPGLNAFTVPLQLSDAAVYQFEAIFEPERELGDPATDVPSLLRAAGVTFTSSRGRVLILTEDTVALGPFLDAIRSEELHIDVRPAALAPTSLAELAGYDAVVLANQPASSFSQAQQEELVSFVHNAGGGLLVLGGPESFGAGGWIGSSLADALPVLLDPPQKRQMPMGALALIIDRSGSMGAPVSGTNLNQQQIANEAAILGVRALSRLDQVAVVAFSDGEETVVPLAPCSDADGIARRIRSIGPGGGTNLFPAIDAAAAELAKSPAGVKHIIILTDGQTVGSPNEGLGKAADLKRRGVTISTVAIGDTSNDDLLKRLAFVGGGRSYTVSSANSLAVLPQIFIKEAQTVRRTLIWEGPPFSPKVAVANDALRGIAAPFPATTGYVVTADRDGLSTVCLRGPEGDPILAQWQHGLGRVTAYTSDATTRWNTAWTSWGSFAAFWRQQLHWTMRPTGDPRARISIETKGERAKVAVELFDDAGDRLNFAQVRGRVMHPGSDSHAADLALRQVGPGRYEGEVEATEAGTHLVALRYDAMLPDADGAGARARQGTIRAAVVRKAGEELRRPSPNTELLWQAARQTNGRIYRLDPFGADLWVREHLTMPTIGRSIWLLVALAGIAAFLLDVAARRIAIDPERVRAWTLGLLAPAPAKRPPESLTTLAAAKARAAASMQPRTSDGVTRAASTVRPATTAHPTHPEAPPAQPLTPDGKSTSQQQQEPGDTMERLRAAKKRSLRE